jgi:hypothetical protein
MKTGIILIVASFLPILPNPWWNGVDDTYGGERCNFWTWLQRTTTDVRPV